MKIELQISPTIGEGWHIKRSIELNAEQFLNNEVYEDIVNSLAKAIRSQMMKKIHADLEKNG